MHTRQIADWSNWVMRVIWQARQLNLTLVAILLTSGYQWAFNQNPQLQTKGGNLFPTVVFTGTQWSANPGYYSIAVDSAGNATYQSTSESVTRRGLPCSVEFLSSSATRTKIFQLTGRLQFFSGNFKDIDSGGSGGTNTLAFSEGSTHNQIT
jgi:hypothetical protein